MLTSTIWISSDTSDFVNEIFRAIETGSYKPGYIPTQTQPFPAASISSQKPSLSTQPDQDSRKRSYNEAGLGGPDPNSRYASRGDRQVKQMRGRGGRGGRGNGYPQGNGYNSYAQSGSPSVGMPPGFQAMPTLPGMPQFDPNDPMSAIIAMQAMGMPLPGMEGMLPQQMDVQTSPGSNRIVTKGVCRDYVNKGFCTRGNACPYKHVNPVVVPGQNEGMAQFSSTKDVLAK